jgi:formylglycine-generating enzyme
MGPRSSQGRVVCLSLLLPAMPTAADPVLVKVSPGTFVLGTDAPRQGPPTRMDMPAFEITANEITVGDYRAFVAATGYRPPAGCFDWQDGGFADAPDGRWDDARHAPSEAHPVVCVRWADALAYADWLSASSGARWRMPTEVEWEYAAKGGNPASQPLTPAGACTFANLHDATSAQAGGPGLDPLPCDDGSAKTASVGGRSANGFGLHDSLGNVTEWTSSCWRDAHDSPDADCSRHVARGGAWKDDLAQASTPSRVGLAEDFRSGYFGFRLVRER